MQSTKALLDQSSGLVPKALSLVVILTECYRLVPDCSGGFTHWNDIRYCGQIGDKGLLYGMYVGSNDIFSVTNCNL